MFALHFLKNVDITMLGLMLKTILLQKDALLKQNDAKPACTAENGKCYASSDCCGRLRCMNGCVTVNGITDCAGYHCQNRKVSEIVDKMKLTPRDCLYLKVIKDLQ